MTSPSFSEEKLTAYALGELSPAERREIETEITAHPELQAELKAIQDLAAQLREELSLESMDFETANVPRRVGTSSKTDNDKIISFPKRNWLYAAGILAIAACTALMVLPTISSSLPSSKRSDNSIASMTGLSSEDALPAETPASMQAGKSQPMSVDSPDQLQESTKTEMAADSLQFADGSPATEASAIVTTAPSIASGATSVPQGQYSRNVSKGTPEQTPAPSSSAATRNRQSETVAGYFEPNPLSTPASADLSKSKETLQINGQRQAAGGESYAQITDNTFLRVSDQALSTFSVDVDTAAYSNLRRFLNQNQFPPKDAVRIEELINYFNYNYPQPQTEDPFSVTTEVAKAPWKDSHLLVRIGLQGKTVAPKDRPPANLVFLIDVSGSMDEPNKLPLVIDSMKLLVQKLKPEDRVGIAVYAGNSGMVLPSTAVLDRDEILKALSHLSAGGSTNGAMGIQLAYDMAKAHFIEGGINRVILCTDGDFNVGITDRGDLLKLIQEKAKSKVFLSVFGFGMGNLQDATLEQLADKGNGNYGYIDNAKEAKRTFVDKLDGTLQTIAKDVKIQVEFNPAVVSSYRLIGYENRMLAAEDFNNDKKDAGEIGSGHRVTALYELIPIGAKEGESSIDPLKYQKPAPGEYAGDKSEILNVKLRYKQPEGEVSKLIEHPVKNENIRSFTPEKGGWWRSAPELASDDFQFAAGVVAFGMILRDSPYKGDADLEMVLHLAAKGSADKQEDRVEFIGLVKKARGLLGEESRPSE